MKYYLAVDIGASSGRHILSHMEQGKMVLEEIYRFPNGLTKKNGHLTWDVEQLYAEILHGMKLCKEQGKIPETMGIDTWGVDFVLLDEKDQVLGDAVAYRDSRTDGMDAAVYHILSEIALYERSGIQKQNFNTIYQLMALKKQEPELLAKAKAFLMIPDYFHFLLTGKKCNEYTNASTTQLLNPTTKEWDFALMDMLGYPKEIFQSLVTPGTSLGQILPAVAEEIGYSCRVVVPATHDTGSAVVAVPSNDANTLYISSGTWSLMGTELMQANCGRNAMLHNFTNEGGYNKTYRFLKNIMGLWMIQSVKKEIGGEMSFGEICAAASECKITSLVDANDARFLAPENMTAEVQKACAEAGMQVPEGIAEVAAVIYNSLAKCYAKTLLELQAQTGVLYRNIHVVGGGANAEYLNQLTAKETGINVLAGPTEATAIGNLAVQMIANRELKDLQNARNCIYKSFDIKVYGGEYVS